jgi:acyl-CoA thioesterase I
LVEAADLDFANPDQDPIPLTGVTVGTLDQDGVVTDSNGDATVQFNLGTSMSVTFLRMEEYPQGTGAELDLLTAVRGGYPRKVVIIGTSLSHLTYGDWPALMTPWLKGEAPDPTKVTVVNLAQSGSSSLTGGINKLASVKAENPDTVFMEFSMNDAYTPYSMSLQQSEDNHTFIINDLRADNPNIEIIIQTMNNPNPSGEPRPDIANYYQVARDVATAEGLLLIDHNVNWLNLFNTDPTTWSTYVPDGIHPTTTGYTNVMIPELQQALEP